jgi:arylsulfatase A-like enzyme/Tfp pilus assembly protein PilF
MARVVVSARRQAVAAALAVSLALAAWRCRPATLPVSEAGLSVLLITIDTLRADAVGAYGDAAASTPWIDRLARDGVRFDQAHAHNVVTLPSHANILSGRLPLDHGVRDNAGFRFPRDEDTLATLLKARGYRTAAFPSAFPLAARFGLQRGFDVYDDAFLRGDESSEVAAPERPGPETVAAAQAWLRAQGEAPTFLWVHLYEPHFPYEPPPPWAARYAQEPYKGEVGAADEALRPLLEPLLEKARAGRTLVVLTADHGESLGEHGEKTHGIFTYEGPLRVPLIVYAPRLFRPAVVTEVVGHADVVPTILEALAVPVPAGLPGRSLRAVAAGTTPAPPLYFEALSGNTTRRWAPLHGILRGRTKYIDLPIPELYDLASDPGETANLAAARPEERERMRAILQRFRAADPGPSAAVESAQTRERLRALGYLSAAAPAAARHHYTEDDDPKRLIALEAEMETVAARQRAGDLAGALALCQDIVRRRPQMPSSLLRLALLHREMGHVQQAITAARRALALNPDDPETAARLGRYLNEAGRPRETVDLLETYARRIDAHPEVLMVRGVALAEVGRGRDALATLERVREGDPSNAMALVNIATVHLMAGDRTAARAALDAALAQSPHLARAHNTLGVLAAEAGRTEEAIQRWKRAAELDPREVDTLFNLGALFVREGRHREARPYLERFVREAPAALYARDIARVRGWLATPN